MSELDAIRGRWRGRTVACVASGPSLTREDCEAVRGAGLSTIVVNSSWTLVPWADVLFAMDAGWWRDHLAAVERGFAGERWGYVRFPGVRATKGELYPRGWGNSGSFAISLAVVAGAARIVLLGYDCQFAPDGRKHWHDDHPPHLGNAKSVGRWPYQFELVAKYATDRGVRVVNCSRATALTCFERGSLEKQLEIVAAEA